MKLNCVCVCVSGLVLVLCLSVFCEPCSNFKDCHTCTNQTGCFWMDCINVTACGNNTQLNASQCKKTDCDDAPSPIGTTAHPDTKATATSASTQSPNTTANGTTPHTPSNTTVVPPTNTTNPAKTSAASANGTTPHTPSNTTVVPPTNTTNPAKTSAASASTTASPRTGSRFDAGSFIGGILLTLGMTAILFMGYKFSCVKREVQYRTIEEHDAII
ncbi:sialomucin core protein 24 [Acipenser oxyrinchus oxyrinchus]|uniref:Sialomucin core protein 24 n=1 Tax=Acipenser oxyrinchus oxyrinchus TaxID=40147 RepID=A0AAD8DJE4_ACIOX|nr:sialomucin core protein 24 [Acipenser oxyrinchus oxyrinchus]